MTPAGSFSKWPRVLAWSAVSLAGVFSLAVLAWSRGEPVNALWVVIASVCVFAISYRFHSAWLMAKVLTLDELRATPAVVHEDGRDFVKTNRWVVFGHHFAAIAGPGPLVGPVLAAQFGFLPGLLWMLIGATLGGAVHDSVILFCSTRRRGKSLGQMISEEINPLAGIIALVSILAILVILIAVLGLVVVNALAESPWGLFTIAATMPIAVFMGLAMRGAGHNSKALLWISVLGVVALLASVYAGKFVHDSATWSAVFTLKGTTLAWWMIGYGLLASVLPVWLLLAPRDYLSTFMKIGTVALLAVAIVAIAPMLKMPSVTKFVDGTGPVLAGSVFPFCFITIACAAVSGFHSLISSGTTPKMITRESDIRVIGYGAMVTEMLVGVMALIAACAMEPGEYFSVNMKGTPAVVVAKVTALGYPVTEAQMASLAADVGEQTMIGRTGGAPTFAVGMAKIFSSVLGSKAALALWYHFAIMFEALFILTTIDAGTRVGRFLMQDLLGRVWSPLGQTRSTVGNVVASAAFVAAWGWFLYAGVIDPLGGINSLWPIFGVANQLLAVLALALGTTVLIKMGRVRYLWATIGPLIWLLAVTMTAGWMKIFSGDPRVGFLRAAADLRAKIAAGGTSAGQVDVWQHQLTNSYVNVAVTGAFMFLVLLVVLVCAREWWLLLGKHRQPVLREEPYVTLSAEERGQLLAR
ncbi:MAG: carbon starvation CstA family protein [Nibricoccus sp.]